MICTAPCFPPCTNEASATLLNAQSRAVLGHNCEQHLEPLLKMSNGKNDYASQPLPEQPQ